MIPYNRTKIAVFPNRQAMEIFVSGFEKRGHFAHVIFERTPVFKWLLVGQILLKLNEFFVYNI